MFHWYWLCQVSFTLLNSFTFFILHYYSAASSTFMYVFIWAVENADCLALQEPHFNNIHKLALHFVGFCGLNACILFMFPGKNWSMALTSLNLLLHCELHFPYCAYILSFWFYFIMCVLPLNFVFSQLKYVNVLQPALPFQSLHCFQMEDFFLPFYFSKASKCLDVYL